jgi:putative chitinase
MDPTLRRNQQAPSMQTLVERAAASTKTPGKSASAKANGPTKSASDFPVGFLIPKAGGASKKTAGHSHYLDPLGTGEVRGRSRRWGDAEPEVQRKVISAIIEEGQKRMLGTDQIAFAIAVARVESGWNPDAAAQSTSASGIGQLIDRTAKHYGLTDSTRFDVDASSDAFYDCLLDSEQLAKRKHPEADGEELSALTYAHYHDGTKLVYGGLDVAESKVMPWYEKIKAWFDE